MSQRFPIDKLQSTETMRKKPMNFPQIIHKVATAYNLAYVMIEINDIGGQVADALQFDLEYDNLIMTTHAW